MRGEEVGGFGEDGWEEVGGWWALWRFFRESCRFRWGLWGRLRDQNNGLWGMHHTYMRECLWSWGCVGEEGVGWMVVIRDRLLSMEKRWREMRFWVWSLLLASYCIVEVHIYPRSEIDSKYRFPLKGPSSFPSIFVCMQYHMPNCIARWSYPSLCSIITYPILFFHQTP